MQLTGLLNGDERADAHVGQALDGLGDDLDVLALRGRGVKQLQAAQLRRELPGFRRANDDHRHGEGGREDA